MSIENVSSSTDDFWKRPLNPDGIAAFLIFLLISLFISISASGTMTLDSNGRIRDQNGREITVSRPFRRIISLYPAHTENLFFLHAGNRLIGVSTSENFPEKALEKPTFSYRDDPEKFMQARPDLVLIRPMIDRSYPDLISRLEKSGITVLSFQPQFVDDMYLYWMILGQLTGEKNRAIEKINLFRSCVAEFQAITQPILPKKKVYFEAIHQKFKTFTPNSFAAFALEAAGGINIASDAHSVRDTNIAYYGKERLLSKGVHIDAYFAQTGKMNRTSNEIIRKEPGFQLIRAVRENSILIIDETIISRPTIRLLKAIYEMGNFLYGSDFSEKGMKILEKAQL